VAFGDYYFFQPFPGMDRKDRIFLKTGKPWNLLWPGNLVVPNLGQGEGAWLGKEGNS